ncbi:MAG: hypothetical protein MJ166_01165 [Clostridia bacterium]|nr:hypothetical protein [Clostridia bacterium]
MAKKLVAVIDIGSLTARLKIYELAQKKKPKVIETIRKYTSIGVKALRSGALQTEQINEICDCLNNFEIKCREYKVSKIFCVATSALRDAGNRDVVLEQIKTKTGFKIDVLDNATERYFQNLAVRETMVNFKELVAEGTMFLDIGAGSMQATVYDKSEFVFSQNTVLGSLRISEMLSDIQKRTTHYEDVLEEFISQDLDDYHAVEPKGITYKNLIAFGGETGFIKLLAGKGFSESVLMTKKEFMKVYEYLLHTRPSDITLDNSIPSNVAPLLLPAALIIKKMLEYTGLNSVYLPIASLSEGIVFDYAFRNLDYKPANDPMNDLISGARNIAKRYKSDKKHIEFVENAALEIFDASTKCTGLRDRERLLLQLSCILHEIGKFINAKNHNAAAHMLIEYLELVGVDNNELDIIGLVVRLYPRENPYSDSFYLALPADKKVLVSKLTAILRLADALDSSHRQKINKINVHLQNDELNIICNTTHDCSFEEWSFEHRRNLFEEIIGIKSTIKIRRQV